MARPVALGIGRGLVLLWLLVAAARAGHRPGALSQAALELDTWEGLTEMVETDLGHWCESLEGRSFRQAGEWFTSDFRGERLATGRTATTTSSRFATRIVYGGRGALVDRGVWLGDLAQLLSSWSRIDAVDISVLDASFDDAGGRKAGVTVRLEAEGAKAGERPEAITATWRGHMRFQLDRYRFSAIDSVEFSRTTAPGYLFHETGSSAGVAEPTTAPLDIAHLVGGWQGAAAGDVNGDGLVDLFVASSPTNHLYINQGDGTFVDSAGAYGVTTPAGATGALIVDLDNDGMQDLVLGIPGKGVRLFVNTGSTFRDATASRGLATRAQTYSLAAADIDNDGLLDLYACSYNTYGIVAPASWYAATNGTKSLLFHNQKDHFVECAAARGVADGRWSYAAAFADVDRKGSPDLFVGNDYGENGLYINDGRGYFKDEARARGVNGPGEAMGADWGDFDGDGRPDLYVTNIASTVGDRVLSRLLGPVPGREARLGKTEAAAGAGLSELARGNALYLNRPGRFADVRQVVGVDRGGWAWGGGFLDFDNDGWLDIFCTNGFLSGGRVDTASTYWRHLAMSSLPVPKLVQEKPANRDYLLRQFGPVKELSQSFAGRERDRLYHSENGRRATDLSTVSGCDDPGDGRAVVFFDYDNDGGTDIFVHNIAGQRNRLYHNQVEGRGAWVRLELVGTLSNRDGIGARIEAQVAGRTLFRWVAAGSGFVSASDRRPLIGLGGASKIDRLLTFWPSGRKEDFGSLAAGRTYRIVEGTGRALTATTTVE